jgi:hypothetical protein
MATTMATTSQVWEAFEETAGVVAGVGAASAGVGADGADAGAGLAGGGEAWPPPADERDFGKPQELPYSLSRGQIAVPWSVARSSKVVGTATSVSISWPP